MIWIWNIGIRVIFLRLYGTTQTRTTHAHSHPMNTRTQTLSYEHLRRPSQQILEIDEVITGASLSTGTSPTIECTSPITYFFLPNVPYLIEKGPFFIINLSQVGFHYPTFKSGIFNYLAIKTAHIWLFSCFEREFR